MSSVHSTCDTTVDAFHRGRFHLEQPARRGHRAGLDAMLLAAAVPGCFSGRLADLGAGAGAAGLAVAARCTLAEILLVENDAIMANHARRSLALAQNAWLAGRCSVLVADVLLAGRARVAAGLADHDQDWVIMNPPFNCASYRASPDPLRRAAHVLPKGQVAGWLRTAAAILRPGGGLAVIARPELLVDLLEGLVGRFGGIEVKPVHPRPAAAAIRIVLRAASCSRKPLCLLPPLILHGENGNAFTAEAERMINGEAALFGD